MWNIGLSIFVAGEQDQGVGCVQTRKKHHITEFIINEKAFYTESYYTKKAKAYLNNQNVIIHSPYLIYSLQTLSIQTMYKWYVQVISCVDFFLP